MKNIFNYLNKEKYSVLPRTTFQNQNKISLTDPIK